ncbi:Phage terminase, large subunit GpA [Monaibacterium marinum]|uniref:Phage terminase, large subunit GpA n=1 Tax=Pontivivens marinum TaxID=1690039 RepID=A0A2C9CQA1_9RHOB|nr:terminase gpA endonuclease subunit [Monaibacterium marinum]SOH93365.1 Phage terminase, large subunit GpA [Monaibacterium marinum]
MTFDYEPLPPFASMAGVVLDCLPSLRPPARISVTQACERYLRVKVGGSWQRFDRGVTPYMNEPLDMMASRRFLELIFVGPARAGKSELLLKGTACYAIACDPGPVHVTQMDRDSAKAWAEDELAPSVRNSPDLAALQGKARSDRNIFSKRFIGGTKISIGAPTASNFASRTSRFELITDLDRMKLNIDGEGAPFSLAAKRPQTLLSRGMAMAESSPGHPIQIEDWTPQSVHELPPCEGIVGLYNGGTRARWYWDCPHCGEAFEPRFDLLEYDAELPPAQAGASAEMKCPECGALISASEKPRLNRSGYWLHETNEGGLARVEDPRIRSVSRLSYHLNGAAAAFASWSAIVSRYMVASQHARTMGDETGLQVVVNTDIGLPYRPSMMDEENALTAEGLLKRAEGLPRGEAPDWTRFVLVSVDVQKGRFVVQVEAWGTHGERALIDRFDLAQPPDDAPGAGDPDRPRALAPERYSEDWDVLRPLLDRVWPVSGQGYGLRTLAVGCDMHGQPGVTDQAEKFWRKMRREGLMSRFFLIRGHGGLKQRSLVWYAAPERAHGGKKARGVKILNIATDLVKDSVTQSLTRLPGPGAYRLGNWIDAGLRDELCAERRGAAGWEMKAGVKRNEAFDLAGYNLALARHHGIENIDWDAPPDWAAFGIANVLAVPLRDPDAVPSPPEPQARSRPRTIKYLGG